MSGVDRAAIPEAEAGGILTVDLGALAANWRDLAGRVALAECAAVVKGDAYGTGLETSAAGAVGSRRAHASSSPLLSEGNGGCAPPCRTPPSIVLNGLFAGTEETYRGSRLRPVLGSLPEIALWTEFCATARRASSPAALHVDTGMNRLGLAPSEAVGLAETREEIGFDARPADEPSRLRRRAGPSAQNRAPAGAVPRARWRSSPAFRPRSPIPPAADERAATSISTWCGRASRSMAGARVADLAQPAAPGGDARTAPSCRSSDVHAGETIGYGAAATMPRDSRVAILAAGYADGIPPPRSAPRTTRAAPRRHRRGPRCPLIGRISMDLMASTSPPCHHIRPPARWSRSSARRSPSTITPTPPAASATRSSPASRAATPRHYAESGSTAG